VKVKLSPPSKLRVVVGKMLDIVHSISSATNWSELGIIPRVLVRIGRWIPHVGSSSKVHVIEAFVKVDSSRTQFV
jgi:hypothetical protein